MLTVVTNSNSSCKIKFPLVANDVTIIIDYNRIIELSAVQ